MLEVEGLKKSFGRKEVLKGIDFSLKEGEVLGVVGESGSGKSTLGKIILRLLKPSSGSVRLFKRELWDFKRKEFGRLVSAVFQDPSSSLNPKMSVEGVLREVLRTHGVRDYDLEGVLERVGLGPEFLKRKVLELSGGQKQRLAVARAILLSPKLIVADEPTSSLDATLRKKIVKLFKDLKEKGIALIFITHDLRLLRGLADKILVLYGGVRMEYGPAEELLKEPKNPYTRYLISSLPVRNPRERGEVFNLKEIEPSSEGCPFYNGCQERLKECKKSLRVKRVGKTYVSCNLY